MTLGRIHQSRQNNTLSNSTAHANTIKNAESVEISEEHKELFYFIWYNFGPQGIAINVAIVTFLSFLTMILVNNYRKSLIKYEQHKIYGIDYEY